MASTCRIISVILALIWMFAFKDIKAASECADGFVLNKNGLCVILVPSPPEVIEEDNCTKIDCPPLPVKCPSDSYLEQIQKPPNEENSSNATSVDTTKDLFTKCCKPDEQSICRCLPCPLQKCDKGDRVNILRTGQKTPGQCCDLYQCVKKECISNGQIHDVNTTWMSDSCHNCTCREGGFSLCENTCKEYESEELFIGKTRRFSDDDLYPESEYPGELDTAETPSGCIDNKTIYHNGHTWKPDVCTECLCENGKKQCFVSHCKVNCLNPRKVADECCPICDDDCHLIECHNNCPSGYVFDDNNCQTCQCISVTEDTKLNTSTSVSGSSEMNQTHTIVDVSTTEKSNNENTNKQQQNGSGCFIWVIVITSVVVVVAAVGVFILYRYVKKCKITTNDKICQTKYEQVAVFDNNPVISNKEKIYPDLVNKI